MHISPITEALSSISIGPEVVFRNLAMFPLVSSRPNRRSPSPEPSGDSPRYTVLDDALASGVAEVTEVSESGSVPELRVVNRGPKPTLIVDGEELVGAKQNRIVNLTILVPGEAALTIPVSCVEAGRWRAKSRAFKSAPRTQYASGRAKRMADVSYSMRSTGERMSDQSAVWSSIAEKSARLKSSSPTGAMEAIFMDHAPFIASCVNSCRPIDGQVGALFAVNGVVIGFDLFDCPLTLRKLLPKLVSSVAVEALDSTDSGAAGPMALRSPELFLSAVGDAPFHTVPAVGLGQDLRLSAPGLTGAALVADGQVVHLSAFAMA